MKHPVSTLFLIAATAAALFPSPAQAQAQNASEGLNALVQVLQRSDDPEFQYDILKGMSDGLKGRRGLAMPTGWEAVAKKLETSTNAQVRELAQSLSLTFGSASALNYLREKLIDPKTDPAPRKSALESLVQARDPKLPPILQRLLSDPAMRLAALRGLAAFDDAKTPSAILDLYPKLLDAEKREALNTLASRATFAKQLLVAVDQKTIPSRDLTADIVRQLRNLKDPDINAQVQKVWGLSRETEATKLAEIARYKNLIQTKTAGNSSRGRAVFARTCQQCHTLFDTGGKVGPDITGSNRSDLDYLLQNIIDPNAVIPNDYRTSTLETKDDRVITGIVTRQDNNTVTIVVPNETIVVGRKDIKSLVQGDVSMMPEGLFATMTENDTLDLIAYLRSPVQVPIYTGADNRN